MAGLDPLALEEVAALGWRPVEEAWQGRWLLRASQGFTGRANSVLPLGDPGRPLADALDQVGNWYLGRCLVARFQLPLPATAALDAELATRGWTACRPSRFCVADVSAVLASTPPSSDVRLDREPSAEWLAGYHDYRGGRELPPVARRLMMSARAQCFASIVAEDRVVAIGRAAYDAGWAGVSAMAVDPAWRRRGLASRLLGALCGWAADTGAASIYLQVGAENTGARALYARHGFLQHHRYQYRQAPS